MLDMKGFCRSTESADRGSDGVDVLERLVGGVVGAAEALEETVKVDMV
jgi:hypothetical protein